MKVVFFFGNRNSLLNCLFDLIIKIKKVPNTFSIDFTKVKLLTKMSSDYYLIKLLIEK